MRFLSILCVFFLLNGCVQKKDKNVDLSKVVVEEQDKEIQKQIFELFADQQGDATSLLMVKLGTYFMSTPYVGHTLEQGEEEQLVVNLRELDCTTFVENCLALAKTIQSGELSFEQFVRELKNVRYRNGIIDGYTSRLHYTSDWIFENQQKRLVKNVTKEIAPTPYPKEINFMSTHPDSYNQLKENPQLVDVIAQKEKDINSRQHFFIPEQKLAEVENLLMDGDIVGITTSIQGLDISHVGILVRKAGRIHLLHASSLAKKVVLSDETLEEYLLNSKSATGIVVARPL
ncbi:Protein of unknown function [Mariniphaga anaerophila]|uniref:DUF1460 domain-containing protein n=1 Tax=Mariniphaga anaerophila TaxID=1484053 RepID=A0A1M4TJN5_9BACT|nr:N-acetylmuramoyl-L-alanine amidase-like domain-containing protein [Mariniphaga anaerophila]SHE44574.1 Protein of unknown function [Mariniphaga anaerophila]